MSDMELTTNYITETDDLKKLTTRCWSQNYTGHETTHILHSLIAQHINCIFYIPYYIKFI